ncbi:Aste57867_24241 [Aphanomyces stellatus]|uniref:Aste57867_24241 protein n=1 Tax=Aphanomyces stellatus TaxID=120398 RepID=A0A485LQ46_9STRA|nr:hypothetical protein As57867_024166 [Aphanomyces stellatus]VFU00882.1 Aste57867_24241 [Aphanomyces stellatus]
MGASESAVEFRGTPACKGGLCLRHGGTTLKRYCDAPGYDNQAHANRKCVQHGGGRYCKTKGCSFHARLGSFCLHHNQDLEPLDLGSFATQTPLDGVEVAILDCLVAVDDSVEGPTVEMSTLWSIEPK